LDRDAEKSTFFAFFARTPKVEESYALISISVEREEERTLEFDLPNGSFFACVKDENRSVRTSGELQTIPAWQYLRGGGLFVAL